MLIKGNVVYRNRIVTKGIGDESQRILYSPANEKRYFCSPLQEHTHFDIYEY